MTFKWTAGSGVSAYWLHLGTTGTGSANLFSSGSIKTTSVTVKGLPLTGVAIYASIYSEVNGAWKPVNYTYTATGLAALTSPAANTVFPGSSVTFKWSAGKGIPAYWLHLGTTGAGSSNLYSSGSLKTTSVTVTGLPMKGVKIYATLYSSVQGAWTPVNYTYTEPALPAMTSPATATILPSSTATFKWTAGTGITGYWLRLGTKGAGSEDLYSSGSLKTTSVTVSGLPLKGVKVYATLFGSIDGGAWLATPAVTYTEPELAVLTSPASGTVLSNSSASFSWTAGTGITAYWLHLGTKGAGSEDIYSSGSIKSTSITVNSLPTYGMTLYATLYSELNGAWMPVNYSVTEAGKPVLAALTSPTPGSVLHGSPVTFTWSAGHGPTAYLLHVGTTGSGSDNLYSSGTVTGTSVTAASLPSSGVAVSATLYSMVNGAWQPMNYSLVEAAPSVSTVSCASVSVLGPATDACTVTLNSAALSGAVTVTLSSNNAAVKVPATVTVPSGGISASFNATVAAVTSAQSVIISAIAGGATQGIAVQVNAPAPGLSINLSSIAFGNVNVNTPVTQQVILTSSGNSPVTINSVSTSGAGFSVSGGTFPVTLNPTQPTSVQVQFDPTVAGAAAGVLTINSNAASGATATVNLSGTGIPTPSAVNCTNSSMTGAGTDACTVTLNVAAAAGGAAVTVSSNNSAVTVPAGVTVASGATSAGFSATVSAVSTAQTVTLTATAGGISKTFGLSLGASNSTLTANTSSLNFNSVNVSTSSTQSVTLTASGTQSLTINSATASGAGFTLVSSPSFPLTLNSGGTATLTVQFAPTAAGAASGTLTVSSTASSGGTTTVGLSGTGQPTPSAVSCTNSSMTGAGTDACTVTLNVAAAAGGAAVSVSSNNSAVTVPAGVTVASGATSAGFTATVTGVSTTQNVTLTAAAGGVTQTFALQLNAGTPTLGIGATTVAFGSVTLNDPMTQSLLLTSTGTAPVTISAASVTGTGYSMSPMTFPLTLNPKGTATVELQFDPTTAGSPTGQLTITSNSSSGGTATVTLTGTGVAPTTYQVNLSWDAPTGSSVTISGYNVYRATSGSSSYQAVNPTLDTQTGYNDTGVSSGTTYDYYVESVDSAGVSSAPSTIISISVP